MIQIVDTTGEKSNKIQLWITCGKSHEWTNESCIKAFSWVACYHEISMECIHWPWTSEFSWFIAKTDHACMYNPWNIACGNSIKNLWNNFMALPIIIDRYRFFRKLTRLCAMQFFLVFHGYFIVYDPLMKFFHWYIHGVFVIKIINIIEVSWLTLQQWVILAV